MNILRRFSLLRTHCQRQSAINPRHFASLAKMVKPDVNITNTQLYINGKEVDSVSGKKITVVDPRNEEVIAQVAEGDAADIDIAVQAAQTAYKDGRWSNIGGSQRGLILNRFADLLDAHSSTIAAIDAWDVGQPIALANGFAAAGGGCVRYYAGWADKIHGKTIPCPSMGPEKFFGYTLHEPLGVVGTILPWNAPNILFCWQIAPALACGNTIVVKPAETAPLSALYIAQLAAEAGVPDGVINVVPGYGETAGQALCKHPVVQKISFTGESITGKEVMTACAQNLTPVTLELGGKSPVIIFPDADIDLAVQITQFGLFTNSGQICTAGSRVFCHESVYDEFAEKTVAATAKRRVGDNFTDVDQGPQQNKEQFAKVLGFLERGKAEGADLLCGGNRVGDSGYFVESTVFGNVTDEMDIARKEIFGPCMQILKWADIDEVCERANNTTYGLAAGIITNNNQIINRMTRTLEAGTIWVNTWHKFFVGCPFGGYKQSGIGRVNGEYALANYTQPKTVIQTMEHEGSWY